MDSSLVPNIIRLSVLVPQIDQPIGRAAPPAILAQYRAQAERTLHSVLEQSDPIGTEILLIEGSSSTQISDHISSVFSDAVSSGKLRILRFDRTFEAGKLINQGGVSSQGSFLAFIKPGDTWKPGRLSALEPLLPKHDLIVATNEDRGESTDWIRAFITENRGVPSSTVIRRTLFDEIGGFPETIARIEDYALWLKAVAHLSKSGDKDRFLLMSSEHIQAESQSFGLPPGSPLASVPALHSLLCKVQKVRESLTLVTSAKNIPSRYWGTIAKRIFDEGKSLLKK